MLDVNCGGFRELEDELCRRLAARGNARLGEFPPPVAVVAPSRRLVRRLKRAAVLERGQSLLNVHFHTFYSLAFKIAAGEGLSGQTLISDPLLERRALEGLCARRPELAAGAGMRRMSPGLLWALRSSLKDLIDAGISGESLDSLREALSGARPEAAQEGGGPGLADRSRLAAILDILEIFEDKLEALGVATPSSLLDLAARGAARSRFLESFSEILFYGFYDLTGLQIELFEAAARARPSVLYFPFRRGDPAFEFALPFFESRLSRHRVTHLVEGQAQARPPEVLISASGAADEAWACAKEILRLNEEKGVPFEKMAVVARSLEPYASLIRRIFRENQIPFEIGAEHPLLSHPFAALAFKLLNLRRRDFPAQALADILDSPYFKGAGPRPRGGWRRALRLLGVHSGLLQWEGRLAGSPVAGGEREALSERERRGLWEWLLKIDAALARPSKPWGEQARAASAFTDAWLGLPPQPTQEERLAVHALSSGILDLSRLDILGEELGFEEFLDHLADALGAVALPAPVEAPKGVRVLDAMAARGESFDVVFLVGLKAGFFPRTVREDPLLRDRARSFLRDAAGYWIRPKLDGLAEERLLFDMAACLARNRAFLIYPRSDEQGAVEIPSPYLSERLGREDPRRVPRQPLQRLESAPPGLLTPRELGLLLSLQGREPTPYLRSCGLDAELSGYSFSRLGRLGALGPPGDMDAVLERRFARPLFDGLRSKGLSAKALGTLHECPFRFFAGRVLGLADREEAFQKAEAAPKLLGIFYAQVLEDFYKTLPDSFWDAPASSHESFLESALDRGWGAWSAKRLGVYPVLWEALREEANAALSEFVAWDIVQLRSRGLRPLWFERELSCDWEWRGKTGVVSIPIKGRVDRVDKGGNGESGRVEIVDYKKKRPSADYEKTAFLQIGLYRELVSQALSLPRGGELSARLAFIELAAKEGAPNRKAARFRELPLSREAFSNLMGALLQKAADGRFLIIPSEGPWGHCAHCPHALVCRKDHRQTRIRAALAQPG